MTDSLCKFDCYLAAEHQQRDIYKIKANLLKRNENSGPTTTCLYICSIKFCKTKHHEKVAFTSKNSKFVLYFPFDEQKNEGLKITQPFSRRNILINGGTSWRQTPSSVSRCRRAHGLINTI